MFSSIKYKDSRKEIEILEKLCSILDTFRDTQDNKEYTSDINYFNFNDINTLEMLVGELIKLNMGADTVELNGHKIKLDSIDKSVREMIETEQRAELNKCIHIIKDIKGLNLEVIESETRDRADNIKYETVKCAIDTFESVMQSIKELFGLYGKEYFEYSSDEIALAELTSSMEARVSKDTNNVERCLKLYNGIHVDDIKILSTDEIEHYTNNIDQLLPSKRTFINKMFNTFTNEDKEKYKILVALKSDLQLRKARENETIGNYTRVIYNELSQLDIMFGEILDTEITIVGIENDFRKYLGKVLQMCKNTLAHIEEYIENQIDAVHEINEIKKNAEGNIGQFTQGIANILRCENNANELYGVSKAISMRIQTKIDEQFSLIDSLHSLANKRNEYYNEIRELNLNIPEDIKQSEIDRVLENSDAIELIRGLSGLSRDILKVHTELNIDFKDIINSYMLCYIDALEANGIGLNSNNRYKECIEKINELEKEKNSLISELLESTIGTDLQIDISRYKTFIGDLKKTRGKSIRQLIIDYGDILYQKFPVWMMTPETVSDVLPLKAESFDLVIFDEASQMFIENAIPSLYRSKRAIIAGDDKQLKPTSFFSSKYETEDDDNEDARSIDDLDISGESLLDQAKVTFDSVKLTFHYRSKYAELIQFSNYAFYNSKLKISPNTLSVHSEYRPIEYINCHGIYDSSANKIEAQYIVKLLENILKETSTMNKSVGIITFNTKQKECIIDTMSEFLDEADDETRQRFSEIENRKVDGEDISLFVKNLEDVQGDERDIIIFSIGYGRDPDGKMHQNFGPLNTYGGENRLNVAISRAKEKEYIIASIDPSELRPENSKNVGPKIFKQFLEYAKAISDKNYEYANEITKPLDTAYSDVKFDSPFEEDVFNHLTEYGWQIDTQVGVRGYRIDLAVYDKDSGTYIAGIECDGATYHSSKYARERDISRQRFLEGKGWKILRIWSRDWWHNSKGETERIHQKLLALQNSKSDEIRKTVFKDADTYMSIDEMCKLGNPGSGLYDKEIIPVDYTEQSDSICDKAEDEPIKSEKTRKMLEVMKEYSKDVSGHPYQLESDSNTSKRKLTKIDKMKELCEQQLEEETTDISNIRQCSIWLDICDISKSDVNGKKLEKVVVGTLEIDAEQWWKVLYMAILYKIAMIAAERGINIDKCTKVTRDSLIMQVYTDCQCPTWLDNNEHSHRQPIQIEDANWYLEKSAGSWDMINRALKVIDYRQGCIKIVLR